MKLKCIDSNNAPLTIGAVYWCHKIHRHTNRVTIINDEKAIKTYSLSRFERVVSTADTIIRNMSKKENKAKKRKRFILF